MFPLSVWSRAPSTNKIVVTIVHFLRFVTQSVVGWVPGTACCRTDNPFIGQENISFVCNTVRRFPAMPKLEAAAEGGVVCTVSNCESRLQINRR
jgi:hypothetical protein